MRADGIDGSGAEPQPPPLVSARALRDMLRASRVRFKLEGRSLNEGAQRVLGKLESVPQAGGLRRAYLKAGDRLTMWDLVDDTELFRRGFAVTRHHARSVCSSDSIRYDRVTCWMSKLDDTAELWIGEPLVS